MKKIIALFFTVFVILSLCSCGNTSQKEGYSIDSLPVHDPTAPVPEPEHPTVTEDMYGMWEPVGAISLDGAYPQSVMDGMFEKSKEKNSVFHMELGEKCYIYNADENGVYQKEDEITIDFYEAKIIYTETGKNVAPIDYNEDQIVVKDLTNAIGFVFEKVE